MQLIGEEKSNEVTLVYRAGDKKIRIKETYTSSSLGWSMGVDHEDTKIKDVAVRSNEAKLFLFKDDSVKLVWDDGGKRIMIDGKITEVELIQMAESMK